MHRHRYAVSKAGREASCSLTSTRNGPGESWICGRVSRPGEESDSDLHGSIDQGLPGLRLQIPTRIPAKSKEVHRCCLVFYSELIIFNFTPSDSTCLLLELKRFLLWSEIRSCFPKIRIGTSCSSIASITALTQASLIKRIKTKRRALKAFSPI